MLKQQRREEDRIEAAAHFCATMVKKQAPSTTEKIFGVRPDLRVEARQDVLEEIDGPMLRHGLQEAAGVQLTAPRFKTAKPDHLALEERYEEFCSTT